MRKEPAISVCMPFYNVEYYIEEAIESVLNQAFRDFELILINDGSTDNSIPMILDSDEIELAFTKVNCFTIGVIRTDLL